MSPTRGAGIQLAPLQLKQGELMDTVAIGSILAVLGAVLILIVLAIRVGKLINTTHSQDNEQQ